MFDSIREGTTVGPFAHLRDHSILVHIIELVTLLRLKNLVQDTTQKASHLAYIGDSVVGTLIGGVSYDGKLKHKTEIDLYWMQ